MTIAKVVTIFSGWIWLCLDNGWEITMCGIFGIVTTKQQPLGSILIEAGERLAYRGYDSVGCATLHEDGNIDLRKDVGKIGPVSQALRLQEMQGRRGIIQLRWATFGEPSQVNAQPHLDSDGDLVGAHNGNVVNNVELRQSFKDEGMQVRSTNDGETCVHAVERYVDRGYSLADAMRFAYHDLAGDYAFVIGQSGQDHLCAIKKGSGLVVGLAEGATCISSDLPSILPLTRRYIPIQDGEIVCLWADHVEIRRVSDGELVERSPEVFTESMEAAQKGGYLHFMLKEIYEQPRRAGELIHLLENSPVVLPMVERMANARNLYLVGCGSSYHACMLGSIYLSWLAGRPATPVLAPQFSAHFGPTLGAGDVAVFVSQSGETKDVLDAEVTARRKGAHTLSLVNVIGSTLSKVTERYLPIACGYEISVAASKTFTNQAIALLYLALQMGNVPTASISRLPELLNVTLDQFGGTDCELGEKLLNWSDMYCLGYGATYPISLETALKFKQITYTHCEGMLSTEFKHGSLAAVQPGYPVLFVAGPEDTHRMISSINEVTCRGGLAVVLGEENPGLRANASCMISLPQAGPLLSPLAAMLPLQLLAYRLSVARGIDPDYPRNLTKSYTVD